MATYSEKSFNVDSYFNFRPTYPADFQQRMIQFHTSGHNAKLDVVVDLGCGPGEASLPLLKHVKKHFIATDLSETMIKIARANYAAEVSKLRSEKGTGAPEELTIEVSPSEDLSKVIPEDGIIDLVTAAECAHWFNTDRWLSEMARVLKPNGSLIYFAYCDPVFLDYPLGNEVYEEFTYGDKFLGPYWEQPGRSKLRAMFKPINDQVLADDRFKDVTIQYYNPLQKEYSSKDEKLLIDKEYTVEAMENYVGTWSATHRWNDSHPGAENEAGHLFGKMLKEKLAWTKDTKFRVSFKTVYVLARRK